MSSLWHSILITNFISIIIDVLGGWSVELEETMKLSLSDSDPDRC